MTTNRSWVALLPLVVSAERVFKRGISPTVREGSLNHAFEPSLTVGLVPRIFTAISRMPKS